MKKIERVCPDRERRVTARPGLSYVDPRVSLYYFLCLISFSLSMSYIDVFVYIFEYGLCVIPGFHDVNVECMRRESERRVIASSFIEDSSLVSPSTTIKNSNPLTTFLKYTE